MADSITAAIRDRMRLGAVLFWCVFFTFLFVVLHEPIVQLGITLATGVILGASGVLIEVYDLRSAVKSLSSGVVALLSAGALLVVSDGSAVSVGLLMVAVWMVLDAGQVLRHEGLKSERTREENDDRDGHEVYQEYIVQQVHQTLREQPMTRLDLVGTLEFEDRAIDRALDTLDHRGILAREGSQLSVPSSPERRSPNRFRDEVMDGLDRLARPITIEFAEHGTDESGSGTSAHGQHEKSSGRGATGQSVTSEEPATDEHDREREPAG